MFKKILILIIVILIIASVAIGIRFFLSQGSGSSLGTNDQTERGGIFGFLGFGDSETNTSSERTPTPTENVDQGGRAVFIPTLRQITQEPVSGATFVSTSTIRYVDRGTGHIYETSVNSYEVSKITNTTLPKIYEALWLAEGEGVIYRQLDEAGINIITTYIELLEPTGTSTDMLRETAVTYLPENISSISVSPSGTRIVYIQGSTVTVSNPDGSGSSSFSVPGTQWLVDWKDNNSLILNTKPSASASGFAYTSTLSGTLQKFLGPKQGLFIKPFGDGYMFSESTSNSFRFSTQTTEGVLAESFYPTFPEKCFVAEVFENTALCGMPQNTAVGQYPDSWYKGLVSFTDNIGIYDLNGNVSVTIYQPEEPVDIIDPSLSEDGRMFLFTNKKDLTLWVLNIEEALASSNENDQGSGAF